MSLDCPADAKADFGTVCDDGNPCTDGTCTDGGVCNTAALAAGTPCPGGVCDGAGTCNPCNAGAACNTGELGICAAGTITCDQGFAVCQRNEDPTPEICDGRDNDCDGIVDENYPCPAGLTCVQGNCLRD